MSKEFESSDAHQQETQSEGAKRYDAGKVRWDLIPYDTLEKVAEVFTHGASKYKDENWRAGMSYNRMYGPMFRHLSKSKRGEDLDKDSGCFHLAQVAWGCLCLMHYQITKTGTDDRVKDLHDRDLKIVGVEDLDRQQKMFWDIVKYWEEKRAKEASNKQKPNFSKLVTHIKKRNHPPRPLVNQPKLPSDTPSQGEKYEHFKGSVYEIVCVSFDSEGENEALVTYKDKHNKHWTRPLEMFKEYVDDPNYRNPQVKIPRFKKIDKNEVKS